MRNSFASIAVLAALTLLTACGGGGGGSSGSGPMAVAPVISSQPAGVTIDDGMPASFAVTATGTAPLSYQWQRNGANLSGATAASYNIAAVKFNDSGTTFRVVVSNSAGSMTSANAALTVNAIAPVITSQPASQTVTVNDGSAASFTVVATGSAVLQYRWQRMPAGGSFADVNGATSATYTFVTALANDGDQYQVVVSNSAGTVTSNPFVLLVTPTSVRITTQPESQHVSQGKPVTFTVVASGSGALTYQWQRMPVGGPFADIPGATSSTYSFTAALINDGDQYQVAVNNGAPQPSLSVPATLTVSASVVAPGTVTISPAPAGGTYAEGTTLTLNAVVDSGATTPLSYQWKRNGVIIPGEVGDHLIIGQLTAIMEGSAYSVSAGNSAGTLSSASFTVHVTGGQLTLLAGTVGGVGSRDGTGSAALFNLPYGAAIDASGNTYVTDKNNHTVRKITPDGVVTTIAGQAGRQGFVDGAGTSQALFNNPRDLTVDGAGNIYVADEANNAIRKIDSNGDVTTLASGGTFNHPSGVALIGTDLYVADKDNNRIRKLDLASGNTVTTVSGGVAGYLDSTKALSTYNQPFGVAADAVNNVLYVADNTNNVVRKIDLANDSVTTVAGVAGPAFFGSVDGSLAVARLRSVFGVAYSAANNVLYLADSGNHAIRKVDLSLPNTDNFYITTFAGLMGSPGAVGGVGSAARFNLPSMVAVNQSGDRLIVVNFGSNTINDVDVLNQRVVVFAGSSAARGWNDGAADGSLFNLPQGLAMDSQRRLYVADNSNNVIRVVDLGKARTDPAYVTTLAGTPGVAGTTDGAAATAQFNRPDGVAVDAASGAVYVADSANNVVRKIAGGQVTTIADAGALLNKPRGIVVGSSGNIYVSSSGNHRIYMINSSGAYTLIAGSGVAGFAEGAVGTGSVAKFNTPVGLSLDAANKLLYVADRDNNAIRKIDVTNPAAATVSTLAGGGAPGSLDGNGNAARFSGPLHVTVDGTASLGQPGSVYVADFGNHAIRKVSASGQVSTVVGVANQLGVKLGALPGGLNGPWGVAVDTSSANNGLFVADDVEQAILNVNPAP